VFPKGITFLVTLEEQKQKKNNRQQQQQQRNRRDKLIFISSSMMEPDRRLNFARKTIACAKKFFGGQKEIRGKTKIYDRAALSSRNVVLLFCFTNVMQIILNNAISVCFVLFVFFSDLAC
jgi:hypothetical protein